MSESVEAGWPVENWVRLGNAIAEARKRKGWDQQELAKRSANSPNTISNYERGRATKSRRIPTGLYRVEQVLGWPKETAVRVLAGGDVDIQYAQPDLLGGERLEVDVDRLARQGRHTATDERGRPVVPPVVMSARDAELTQSGYLVQDVFLRQAKRFRLLKNITLEELATRIAEIGGDLSVHDLLGLEEGTRLLRIFEAGVIAKALDTTMDWLVGSAFSSDAPAVMKLPPNAKEMEAEAKALQRRLGDVTAQGIAAQQQLAAARQREHEARYQAEMAAAMLQSVVSEQREMERQYQYLLGRIDSIRAAEGKPTFVETVPVYEGDEKRAREDDLEEPPFTE
ncbi:helix-turn-helix domain-containing protein [Streptomyces sp. NPDC004262]